MNNGFYVSCHLLCYPLVIDEQLKRYTTSVHGEHFLLGGFKKLCKLLSSDSMIPFHIIYKRQGALIKVVHT